VYGDFVSCVCVEFVSVTLCVCAGSVSVVLCVYIGSFSVTLCVCVCVCRISHCCSLATYSTSTECVIQLCTTLPQTSCVWLTNASNRHLPSLPPCRLFHITLRGITDSRAKALHRTV
jgi:hypothetical protein